jgi:hypothetical protein
MNKYKYCYAGVFAYFTKEAEDVMRDKMCRDGLNGQMGVGWYKWLGGRFNGEG